MTKSQLERCKALAEASIANLKMHYTFTEYKALEAAFITGYASGLFDKDVMALVAAISNFINFEGDDEFQQLGEALSQFEKGKK